MFHLHHRQPNRRMSKSWSWTLDPLLKYSSLHLLVKRHNSEVTIPLWPRLPGKAVKLFFSSLPKTVVWDFVGGVYNFLGSFSPQQKFEATDGPVLQLGYSSLLFGKQRKIHPWGVRAGRPISREVKRRERLNFGSFLNVFFSSPWACSMKIGLARRDVCFPWGSHSSPWTLVCSIFTGFFLSLSFSHTILDSFFLFELPNRMH